MKKYTILLIAIISFIGIAYAAMNTTLFKTKRIYVATAVRHDTSALVSLKNYENVELQTATHGTDSAKLLINVEGYFNGVYISLKRDTIFFGKSTTTTGRAKGTLLRGYTANSITGVESIRVINSVTAGASGDSTGVISYDQFLLGR